MSNKNKNNNLTKIKNSNANTKIPFALEKLNNIKRLSSSYTSLIKQKFNYDSINENIQDSNKLILDANKHSLFLKKINMKEKKNKYYIEGVRSIFNNENLFLENIYKGRKIVVGKSKKKNNLDIFIRINRRLNTKKYKTRINNLSSNNALLINKSNNNQINNNTLINESSTNQKGRKILGGKRNENYISDEDLNNIYHECINRENEGYKENIDKTKNKSFIYTDKNLPSQSIKEVNNMINLQSLVLNKYKLRNIESKKIIDRLIKNTSKRKDKLLLNKINDYRLKKEKIDEEETNNIINENPSFRNQNIKEVQKKLKWLSSLREYRDNQKRNNNKKKDVFQIVSKNYLFLKNIFIHLIREI